MFWVKPNPRYKTKRFSRYLKAVDFYSIGGPKKIYCYKQQLGVSHTGRRRVKSRKCQSQCMTPRLLSRFGIPYRMIITYFTANIFSKKELITVKDSFSRVFFMPAFSTYYPGCILEIRREWLQRTHFSERGGLPVTLGMLPYHLGVSFIHNSRGERPVYALSGGCIASRKKDELRTRLLYFQLPSKLFKYFKSTTWAYLDRLTDYNKAEFFFGSWGAKWKAKKLLHVRGVAKNPVDHPNGGRTKAKQPERSPWGWIAKKQR